MSFKFFIRKNVVSGCSSVGKLTLVYTGPNAGFEFKGFIKGMLIKGIKQGNWCKSNEAEIRGSP